MHRAGITPTACSARPLAPTLCGTGLAKHDTQKGIVFYTIVSCAIRCTKVVTKRMDKDVVPFIISSLKAVLWVQIIPIVIGNIGIDTKSMLAVISAVALSVGIALKPLVENCELARRRFERLLLLAAAAAAAAGVVAH